MYNREYYLAHREQISAYWKCWRKEHPDKAKEKGVKEVQWKKAHSEYLKEYFKNYYKKHCIQIETNVNLWQGENKEKVRFYKRKYHHSLKGKKASKKYSQSPKGREMRKKVNEKYYQTSSFKEMRKEARARHKLLGCTPLNKKFDDSRPHHIDSKRVIFIPRIIHEEIGHDMVHCRNMDQINSFAFRWLEVEELYNQNL